jgi:hypothetical protein
VYKTKINISAAKNSVGVTAGDKEQYFVEKKFNESIF